jgi:hypothetical protein
MNSRKILKSALAIALVGFFFTACNTAPSGSSSGSSPTPASSLGNIQGVLQVPGGRSVQDYYLLLLISGNVAGRYENTHIQAIPDSSGAFLFEDVQPGFYSLVAWGPSFGPLSLWSGGTKDVFFELAAGQSVDVGTVSARE